MTHLRSSGTLCELIPEKPEGVVRCPNLLCCSGTTSRSKAFQKMGRLRFELRTNRLKAECSTAELATLVLCAWEWEPGDPCDGNTRASV
jgi:hypothetical protein